MTKPVAASLIAALVLSSAAGAQTPAVVADATTVTDVTVVAGKIMPSTEDPKSATCEFLVATDPGLRAQIQAAQSGGDPFYMGDLGDLSQAAPPASEPSALYAARMFLPTRFPRNVDPVAAPVTPPGSALPEIGRQYRGVTTQMATGADVATERGERRLYDLATPAMQASMPQFSTDQAIDACRSLRALGGTGSSPGRTEIAYRDKFLPTAFALFDDHRYAESLDYFQKAFDKLAFADGGDEAALMIGKLYLGAPGVDRDTAKAVAWLKKAGGAAFNRITDMPVFDPREPERNTASGEAAMILGYLYQAGAPGLAKDSKASLQWFDRARTVGHVRACLVLGNIYYYGKDAPRDLAQAFRYYKEGATFSDAPAQQALAEMYYTGEAPGGRDLKLAAAWENEAAKIGYAPSLYALANAYENGEGVPADPKRALGLYKLAASEGSAAARNTLGTYFYQGVMVTRDAALARRWFEAGAIAGDPDAMFNLGAMMMKGEGGGVDRTHAWAWLKLAERGSSAQAPAAVRLLEPQMTASEKEDALKLLGSLKS